MKEIPLSERPRERLTQHGTVSLSTLELLAVLLGSGVKKMPVMQLAASLIVRFGSLRAIEKAGIAELCTVYGLGRAKALQLKAALGLATRLEKEDLSPTAISTPSHIYALVKGELKNLQQEHFLTVLLNAKGHVLSYPTIAIGTVNQALIHPREVFAPAIREGASSVVLVHNHPSGDPTPSAQDFTLTKALVQAGALMHIPVRDHVIVGRQGFYSFREKGFIS